jgi:dihydrofolate reductase
MRKLVLGMSMSLDGFVADANGKGDWMFRTQSDVGRAWVVGKIGDAGLHIVGSNTFKQWAGWWPMQTGPIAAVMNEIPKAVFSRSGNLGRNNQDSPRNADGKLSPHARTWDDAEVIGGDLTAGIQRLKKQDGKFMLAQGGISFAQSLAATGLVDEYWLVVHPILLGNGLPLFNKLAQPLPLKLIETQAFATGASWTAYKPT